MILAEGFQSPTLLPLVRLFTGAQLTLPGIRDDQRGYPLLCRFVDRVSRPRRAADFKAFLVDQCSYLFEGTDRLIPRVLVFSRVADVEVDLLGLQLLGRGIDYARFNQEDVPEFTRIALRVVSDPYHPSQVAFELGGSVIDTAAISVVLYRHFHPESVIFPGSIVSRRFALQQWLSAFGPLRRTLDCAWINDYQATELALDRQIQLRAASTVGFRVPDTLITNDPVAARRFVASHPAGSVLKALHHHDVEVEGEHHSMYTRRVGETEVRGFGDLIWAPCIFQEWIDKRSEIRATVIGSQVIAVELQTASIPAAREDIHRAPLSAIPRSVIRLPPEVELQCLRLVHSLNLRYGAVDLAVTVEGEIVFLEVNPTGDWCWLGPELGGAITSTLVSLIEELAASAVVREPLRAYPQGLDSGLRP